MAVSIRENVSDEVWIRNLGHGCALELVRIDFVAFQDRSLEMWTEKRVGNVWFVVLAAMAAAGWSEATLAQDKKSAGGR
jgi:hypothetical protein